MDKAPDLDFLSDANGDPLDLFETEGPSAQAPSSFVAESDRHAFEPTESDRLAPFERSDQTIASPRHFVHGVSDDALPTVIRSRAVTPMDPVLHWPMAQPPPRSISLRWRHWFDMHGLSAAALVVACLGLGAVGIGMRYRAQANDSLLFRTETPGPAGASADAPVGAPVFPAVTAARTPADDIARRETPADRADRETVVPPIVTEADEEVASTATAGSGTPASTLPAPSPRTAALSADAGTPAPPRPVAPPPVVTAPPVAVASDTLATSQPASLPPVLNAAAPPPDPAPSSAPPRNVVAALDAPVAEPARNVIPAPSRTERTAMVQTVVNRYRDAYSSLDAKAAQAVWPSAPAKQLSDAFGKLDRQNLQFEPCEVFLVGEQATATCAGRVTFVPKGDTKEQVVKRRWEFKLRQKDQEWSIDRVVMR